MSHRSDISYDDDSHQFTTTPPETFANFTRRVDPIAYDWVNKVLYVGNTGKHSIQLVTMKGKHQKTVVSRVILPAGIAVDPRDDQRWIYWTSRAYNNAKIERAGLDGSNRELVVGTNIRSPRHLTIDYADNRLFWTDSKVKAISSCDLDGKNVRVVYANRMSTLNLFGIAVFEEKVYWNDWYFNAIYHGYKKNNGSSVSRELTSYGRPPYGMEVYHKTRQPTGKQFIIQWTSSIERHV